MNIKFFVIGVIVLGALNSKATKKRSFEDSYERQLLDFDLSGGHSGYTDSDDSGGLISRY